MQRKDITTHQSKATSQVLGVVGTRMHLLPHASTQQQE